VLVERLQRHAGEGDLQACSGVLHSLLGMSGEVGAPALYHAVRRAYVPMVEAGSWPADPRWAERIATIAGDTLQALAAWRAAAAQDEPSS
jgi:two-component system, CAI-1 autoinducer sensor kinase/phosphatase CqsS